MKTGRYWLSLVIVLVWLTWAVNQFAPVRDGIDDDYLPPRVVNTCPEA